MNDYDFSNIIKFGTAGTWTRAAGFKGRNGDHYTANAHV